MVNQLVNADVAAQKPFDMVNLGAMEDSSNLIADQSFCLLRNAIVIWKTILNDNSDQMNRIISHLRSYFAKEVLPLCHYRL
jgi:hypothetical protein